MRLSRSAVGLAVRVARESADLSAADLADKVNMSASSLSRTENGLRSLEFAEAVEIASTLGIDVPTLLTLAETFEEQGALEQLDQLQKDLIELQQLAIRATIEAKTS